MNPQSDGERLFAAALEIAEPEARREYLESVCTGNEALRRDVESLLVAHHQAGEFLESPPSQPQEIVGGAPKVYRDLEPRSSPVSPAMKPRSLCDYELIEEIARGGMGVVYKGRQISLNRIVAVKMILAGHLAGEKDVKRFRLEAKAAASLVHPNIVSIYEVGEHEGQHYFSMRYVEGRSLAQLVQDGSWQPDDGQGAARLLAKVARAVHFAHQSGVLHRDIKPGNILLDAQGEPHITDFGLAKMLSADSTLTVSGDVLGTPSFMAPEQASRKFGKLTPAADLYSLGAVLYFLLTGRPPFVAETPLDILVQVFDKDALRPRAVNRKVSRELERVCLRCLEKSPERRYPSVAALADDLECFLRGEPVHVPLAGTGSRLWHWVQRQPALAARLITLGICAAISHTTYLLAPHLSFNHHRGVMMVVGFWAAACVLCQWVLARERLATLARFAWVGADAAFLTVVFYLDDALESPLIALYPALIVGSGLWFRVRLVRLTTQFCALGYTSLLLVEYWRHGQLHHPHWHLIVLAGLAGTGFVVAYHVHRVSVLGRFCDSRPDSPGTS
jgi:eukaryotic-like serine/threonine-protein kinase